MFTGVQVAVDNAAFKFDRLWSYNVPEELAAYAVPGARVLVPFGRGGNRPGIVLGTCDPDESYKSIADIERGAPELDEELIRLILWLKETTFCTYYDAVKAVLPKNIRLVPDGEGDSLVLENSGHTETVYEAAKELPEGVKLTARQKEILDAVDGPLTYNAIKEKTGATRETVSRMAEKGILIRSTGWKRAEELPSSYLGTDLETMELSAAQNRAFGDICGFMEDPAAPDTTLLRGVTSSGKTLIYTKLMEKCVGEGRSCMLLVPEIALATQLISRISATFGDRVGILHSALSDTERTLQWKQIKDGSYDIVVGTRSAVFAPLKNMGLIIIDEEQEESYNSDQAPRYRTVRVASLRAREQGAHLLLASATPSVETYRLAAEGKINLTELEERYGSVPLPDVTVTDMREELLAGNTHSIGTVLYGKIRDRLDRKEQVILLINRRGYRTVTVCKECGKVLMCDECSAPLVWHKQDHVHRCHYCGRSVPELSVCPECGGELRHTGIGTQRVEEELEQLFPDARVLRLDLDSAQRKGSLAGALRDFEQHEYDIIVGTQMIAKGLDFANVTLVGVLSIDSLMLMPSYRAFEKAFDMLTQVIGRAGRGDKKGEAVIQTIDPSNPIIQLAAKQDYVSFYGSEIVLRKAHLYPPFCRMCSVCFAADTDRLAEDAARAFTEVTGEVFSRHRDVPLRALGPSPMRVTRVNGSYRYRLLLKCRGDRTFRDLLRQCLERMEGMKGFSRVRVYVDMNNDSDL